MRPAKKVALAMVLSMTISAAAQDRSFPVPDGAKKNASLGGATTLATGKNYTIEVYDLESPIAAVREFYASRLPGATQASEGDDTRFSTSEGTIKLARLGAGTRITVTLGPR
jgi:hypothetical protein